MRFYFSIFAAWLWLGAGAYADVIYLKNGKVILTVRAWIEGDEVKYQMPDGVKSIARALVDDVVKEESGQAKFTRIEPEEKPVASPPADKPKAAKPVLLKGPAKDAKEVSD